MANRRTGKDRPFRRIAVIPTAMFFFCLFTYLHAETRTFVLPDETSRFRPGQNVEIAEVNCVVCHSADYVKVQPPGKGKAFWAAEITKMIKVFGAPIGQEDAAKIADYLAANY